MPSSVSIRVIDRGYKKFLARIESFAKRQSDAVTVGFHSDAGSHDAGVTVVELASWHEFGIGVPERSMIRSWVDENEAEIREQVVNIGNGVASGAIATKQQALNLFGVWAQGDIQVRITEGIAPGLADSTLKKKGDKTTPLIFTGQLLSSVTFKVG